jgi:hypothetical protein
MEFQTWSESNEDARKSLRPDFGLRTWADLSQDHLKLIWIHFEPFFFQSRMSNNRSIKHSHYNGDYYPFTGDEAEQSMKISRIFFAIKELCLRFKAKEYAPNFLKEKTVHNACMDFFHIFMYDRPDVVIELISLYAKELIEGKNKRYLIRVSGESEGDYDKRREEWDWIPFDQFAYHLNDVFSHFGLNYFLTRRGFALRVDEKIIEDVYVPVLRSLSSLQWNPVNSLLSESFAEYRKNTPEGYSTCVTKSVTALEAYLQILTTGSTGEGKFAELIRNAQKNKLIPDDPFAKTFLKDITSVLMQERQATGDAHPRKEYANEKNARLVLNLVMVFLQHAITN